VGVGLVHDSVVYEQLGVRLQWFAKAGQGRQLSTCLIVYEQLGVGLQRVTVNSQQQWKVQRHAGVPALATAAGNWRPLHAGTVQQHFQCGTAQLYLH